MAWKPPIDEVGPKEHIGRRIFDEPMLAGAKDQKAYGGLLLSHFMEKRGSTVSLDRLGRSGIEKAVVRYLHPRADAAGEKFRHRKRFDGWTVLNAEKLSSPPMGDALPVFASPVNGEGLDENKYHAHVVRPQGKDPYDMALHLRYLFTAYGKGEWVRPAGKNPSKHLRFLFAWFSKYLIKAVRRA